MSSFSHFEIDQREGENCGAAGAGTLGATKPWSKWIIIIYATTATSLFKHWVTFCHLILIITSIRPSCTLTWYCLELFTYKFEIMPINWVTCLHHFLLLSFILNFILIHLLHNLNPPLSLSPKKLNKTNFQHFIDETSKYIRIWDQMND